jgi:hypothetical protein
MIWKTAAVCVLCMVLAICAVILTIDIHRLMPKASAVLDNIQAMETNTTRTEAEMAGLLNETRHIAKDEREAETKQLARADELSARIKTLLIDADKTMKHLDVSAVQLGTIGLATNDAVGKIALDVHETMGAAQLTLHAATADLDDPALKESVQHIAEASEHLAVATKEASGAMSDVHKATTYEVQQIMAPVSKIKVVVLFAARVVGRLLGF